MIKQSDVEECILLICEMNTRKMHQIRDQVKNQCKNRVNEKKITYLF